MARHLIDNETLFGAPAASKSYIFVDSTTQRLMQVPSTGIPQGLLSRNVSTASQGPGFSSDTYITASGLQIPTSGITLGMLFRWRIAIAKTNAGTAAIALQLRLGGAQSTGDTSLLTLTQATAQTAQAVFAYMDAHLLIRAVGGAGSGSISAAFTFTQTYGSTAAFYGFGFGIDGTSTSVTLTGAAGQYLGLSLNGGASAAYTISSTISELSN